MSYLNINSYNLVIRGTAAKQLAILLCKYKRLRVPAVVLHMTVS